MSQNICGEGFFASIGVQKLGAWYFFDTVPLLI